LGIKVLALAALEIGFLDPFAALKGFFQYLTGKQIAIFGLDQGAATPGGGGLGVDIENQAGGLIDLDDQTTFQIGSSRHVYLL
jgi:hypothetical protein